MVVEPTESIKNIVKRPKVAYRCSRFWVQKLKNFLANQHVCTLHNGTCTQGTKRNSLFQKKTSTNLLAKLQTYIVYRTLARELLSTPFVHQRVKPCAQVVCTPEKNSS